MTMPEINLDQLKRDLSPEDFQIVKGIISTRGKNKGRLRVSKPKVARMIERENPYGFFDTTMDFASEEDALTGKTAYVWRHVAFMISPQHQHHSMPVMAYCDLPRCETREERKALEDHLMKLANKVVDTVPATQWYGVARWRVLA